MCSDITFHHTDIRTITTSITTYCSCITKEVNKKYYFGENNMEEGNNKTKKINVKQ